MRVLHRTKTKKGLQQASTAAIVLIGFSSPFPVNREERMIEELRYGLEELRDCTHSRGGQRRLAASVLLVGCVQARDQLMVVPSAAGTD